ncbi:MAG: hypothetical protein QXT26_07485, partial [Thermoproteota archaeon]
MRSKQIFIDVLLGILLPLTVAFIALRKVLITPGLVLYGDLGFPYYLSDWLYYVSYAWNHYSSSPNGPISYINVLMFAIPHWLGASAEVSEKMWLFSSYALAGIFMYFAMRILLPKKGSIAHHGACIIASMAYMVNMYALVLIHLPGHLISYAALPLTSAFYIKTLREKENILRNSFLTSIFLSLTVLATHTLAITLFAMAVFWLFRFRVKEGRILQDVKKNIIIAVSFLLINLYWTLPQYLAPVLPEAYFPSYVPPLRYDPAELGVERFGQGYDLLRVLSLNIGYGLFLPSTLESKVIGTLIPIIAFSSLLIHKNDEIRRLVLPHSLLFLSASLVTIRSWPFTLASDFLGKYLFSSGLWWGFIRNPAHFAPLLIYSLAFLAGTSTLGILTRIHEPIEKLILASLLPRESVKFIRANQLLSAALITFLITSPFIISSGYPASGDVRGALTPIMIPEEYSRVNDWLRQREGLYRTWWIPQPIGHMRFSWAPENPRTYAWPHVVASKPILWSSTDKSRFLLEYLYIQG